MTRAAIGLRDRAMLDVLYSTGLASLNSSACA